MAKKRRRHQLKVITQEEADRMQLLTLDEDLMADVQDARYVVLTKQEAEPPYHSKELVTYYTDKKRSSYTSSEGNPSGTEWVYILVHPTHPELLKIGYTAREVGERVKEINKATGVVGEYVPVYMYRTMNGQQLERAVHNELASLRIHPQKEHFQVERETAIQVIKEQGMIYG